MFNKKKLALVAGGVLTLGALAACGPSAGATNTITIWCPPTDKETVEAIIADFKEANPDYADWTIEVSKTVGEGETQALLTADKTNSADVICMADDNIRTAVQGETLLALTDEEKAAIVASDGQEAVDACSIDGTLYGYPYRGDNSYMLFYDTTVVSADQAKSVEGILAACKAAGKLHEHRLLFHQGRPDRAAGHGPPQPIRLDLGLRRLQLHRREGLRRRDDGRDDPLERLQHLHRLEQEHRRLRAPDPDRRDDRGAAHAVPRLQGRRHQQLRRVPRNQKTYQSELGYGMTNLNVMEEADLSNNPFLNAINAQLPNVVPQGVNVTNDFWDPMQTFWANVATGNWGDYGTGLDGAKGALRALVSTTGWVTTELINNGTIA